MAYMNAQRTDWSDLMQEESAATLPLSHQPKYVYMTKTNKSLFDLGRGTKSICNYRDEDLLAELVSDSIEHRGVPVFIDYDRFSNPFFKFKTNIALSAADELQPTIIASQPAHYEGGLQMFPTHVVGIKAEDATVKIGSEYLDKTKTQRDMYPSESRGWSNQKVQR